MRYIVSGYMRTGTSMMMESLIAGGLQGVYDQKRNEHVMQWGDEFYKPNPNGVFEIPFDADVNAYDGKLIKVFCWLLPKLTKPSKIVFMLREPKDILNSYEAMLSSVTRKTDIDMDIINNYHQRMLSIISQASQIHNITICHYPTDKDIFNKLKAKGWPIDPEKASSVFNPKYHRFYD